MDQPSPPDAPSTKQSSAESSLQAFFELFAQRERTEQELIRGLVSICTTEPHATWQALSLMDQYHRRGVLATTFYRELKKELNAIAFGNAGTHVSVDGKTFAHAMAGRTAQLAPAGKFEPTDYLTINLATSQAGKPSTRVKTVMLDLDFIDDADADKTFAQSPGSGTLMGGAPKTKNAGAALRKNLDASAPSTGDATSLLTRHGQPDATETRARVATSNADSTKKTVAETIAKRDETKKPTKLDTPVVARAPIDTTQVDPPHIETHHSKPRFHPGRVDPTPVDPPRIEPIYVEPTIVEAPRFDAKVGEPDIAATLAESKLTGSKLADANVSVSDLAVPEWFEPVPTPDTTIDPIDAVMPASNASQMYRAPDSVPAANFSSPKSQPVKAPHAQPPSIEPIQPASAPVRATNRVGTVLNERYVLVEPVTSGNISMVFKAFDQQRGSLPELERYVAIKCPHANFQNDPRTLAAFRHEYAQSQTILHPNIAKIYDLYDENQCFIVMELLSGEPLDRLLERISPRRLPLPRALAIVREIGLALAHAHDHGVVHGNLQASNVTLTGKGEIRVSDFAQSAGWLPLDAAQAQPTDDLYSLACIAHELLCGCYPESKPPEQRPRYAKHLSVQQWRALRNGLAEDQSLSISSGKLNYIKRWLAELDLRTAEIRLPSLSVLESELAGQRSAKSRTPMAMLGYAGAALGGIVVVAALFILLRGALTNAPAPSPQINQTQLNQTNAASSGADGTKDPIAAAWAVAGTAAPDAPVTSSASDARPTQTNSVAGATVAIDAPDLPTVSFTADRYEVSEQEGVVKLLVQRSEPTHKKLQLRWFTIPGSAQPGVDYVGYQYASLQLQPGQKSAEISIPLIQSSKHDRDVSFDVRISATGEALPGRAVVAKVIVLPAM